MKITKIIAALLICLLAGSLRSTAQKAATVREYTKSYITYPYSDPNPVAGFSKIYPYFRYNGFTGKKTKKDWKVVELENDFIKVEIFPEIGGKVWTAIDKSTGKPFLYQNDVVKFRDIAMRGPWTSGGIEFNYGIVGHTPNCATPVDYLTRKNADGSVSCIIGTLDLLTRTRWSVEINLPKDKAWFTTRSFWHNSTPEDQPYYTWTNAAVKAHNDLRLVFPGTHYIRHDGIVFPWPSDTGRHKDLSYWAQNDFIGSKSYHIAGRHSAYYGAFRENEDFGMLRYANRDEKLGRKMFTWALSDQGKIWEELLTDTNGQYVELQSGRLFNQNMTISSYTPFKQTGFSPYGSDSWTEYWFPFKGTKGVSAANLNGVFNIDRRDDGLHISFSPLQYIQDTITLKDSEGTVLYKKALQVKPMEPWNDILRLKGEEKIASISLNGIEAGIDGKEDSLQRPLVHPEAFDWESAYGSYLLGRDRIWQRDYAAGEDLIRKSLAKDENFIPSLTAMSHLKYRRMEYDSAFYYAKKALSIDTYDANANYYYGLAACKLDKWYDALDGFETAALTSELRSAAYTGLSKLYLGKGDYKQASEYAARSLTGNTQNIDALQLSYLSARLQGRKDRLAGFEKQIIEFDPLNHFILFEKYLNDKSVTSREGFTSGIRNEMPQETCLELAIWYNELHRVQESEELLALAPQTSEILFWRAYLARKEADGPLLLRKALESNPRLVFPFREESAVVMKWAVEQTSDWKPRYYLALIHGFRNNRETALQLLNAADAPVPYAPFYSTRSVLQKDGGKRLSDLQMALKLEPGEWRHSVRLGEELLARNENEKALKVVRDCYRSYPENYIVGMMYVRCLISNNGYGSAEDVITRLNILPFEGATEGHNLYKEIKLVMALNSLSRGQYKNAAEKVEAAKLWPRNLGVGKPYDEVIDTRIEDWMLASIYKSMGRAEMADTYLNRVKNSKQEFNSVNTVLQCLAAARLGDKKDADSLFRKWQAGQTDEDLIKWSAKFYQRNTSGDPAFDREGHLTLLRTISQKPDKRLF